MTCGQLTVPWHFLTYSFAQYWNSSVGVEGVGTRRDIPGTHPNTHNSQYAKHTQSPTLRKYSVIFPFHIWHASLCPYIFQITLFGKYILCVTHLCNHHTVLKPHISQKTVLEKKTMEKNIQISDSFLWIGTSPEENILQQLQSMWFIFERRGWG